MTGTATTIGPQAHVARAADRFVTRAEGVTSRHSFSFGPHYDPSNVGFGLLVVSNDDLVQPGSGYPTHPHRDVEIVTWVLDGVLVHRDSTGGGGVLTPGLAQRMSAGSGVVHAEFNDAGGDTGVPGRRAPLRFVQMWVPPDRPGGDPSYQQDQVGDELAAGRLVTVASGMRRDASNTAVRIGQKSAAMHVARPRAGGAVTLPGAPWIHLYVARGRVDVEAVGALGDGDALRLTDEGGRRVVARSDAELVVWEMHASAHLPPPDR
ncbi:MAG TPA: pirin family protein [Jiangellaceae bacterium]